MPLTPRKYQVNALAAIFGALNESMSAVPLVDMATGTGKSLVLAMTAEEFIGHGERDNARVIATAPSKELVRQNYHDAKAYSDDLDVGIYCAGLSSKDLTREFTIGTINSLVNASDEELGVIDLLMIDECHKVNTAKLGMYRDFIDRLRGINPELRVVGLTATPFRLDGGHLTDPIQGEPIFTKVVYTFGLREGIADGYLVPLRQFQQTRAFDDTKIAKAGGDFSKSALQSAWTSEKIKVAVENMLKALQQDEERSGRKRKHVLAFCCGIQHAKDIAAEVATYGHTAEHISGEMAKQERDRIIEDFKAGKIQFLTNADILTTGFNAKNCDVIVQFRNTLSTSLYIQMLGRGTRTYFPCGHVLDDSVSADERRAIIASSTKPDCLVLDFTSNTVRHGPVEDASTEPKVTVKSEKAKECTECGALSQMRAKACWQCLTPFPEKEWQGKPCPVEECGKANLVNAATCIACGYDFNKHESVPYDRLKDLIWDRVHRVHVAYHAKRWQPEKPPTMRVEYYNEHDELLVTEWLSFDERSKQFARRKGKAWWIQQGGSEKTVPDNVDDAVRRASTDLTFPTFVAVEMNDRGFMEIKDRRFDTPWVQEELAHMERLEEKVDDHYAELLV